MKAPDLALMPPERWKRVKALFAEAEGLPPAEREAFLASECAGDDALQEYVERLLRSDDQAGSLMQPPAIDLVQAGIRGESGTQTIEGERPTVPERPIGPYKVLKELGHGGMGVVYLAARADEHYRKLVAIKVIKGGLESEVIRHFRRERQILAGLDHSNISRLFDGGATEDGLPYFVMEYIEGQRLDEYCDSHRLPIVERLRIIQQVCSAVAYAHRNLIVHRDLKPGNILVTAEGVPRLLDFGIARLLNPDLSAEAPTATGLPLTPEYASPEQARGELVTTASDVYSLGVILYELLTGRRPYRLKSRQLVEILKAVCEEEPERPSTAVGRTEEVTQGARNPTPASAEDLSRTRDCTPEKLRRRLSGDLDNIVLMALRKEPERRYGSVEAFSEDIQRYLVGLPVRARKGTAAYRAGKYVRRHAVGVTAAAAFILLLTSFAVTMAVQSAHLARERDKAAVERNKAEKVSTFLVDLFNVSDPSEAKGNTITAREILDKGAERIAGELKEQPDVKAALMETMGRVFATLGLYDKARPLLEEALKLRRQSLGSEHPDVVTSLMNLANVLDRKGDVAGAEALSREVLATRQKLLGSEHRDVAASMNNLANILDHKGDYAGAESLYRDALAMSRKLLGNEHLFVAGILNNLANVLHEDGRDAEAEILSREALAMKRKLFGSEHPSVANTLDNLGRILDQKGDYAGAERLHRDAVAMRRKLLGNEHPDLAISLTSLAQVLDDKGDYAGAEALSREALAMKRKLFGSEHPSVADSLDNLGRILDQKGDYAGAERLHRDALAMRRKLLGNEHPDLAISLTNLAQVLDDKGDYAGAEALSREALAMRRKLLGNEHPYTAFGLSTLGNALFHEGRLGEAKSALQESLAVRRKALSPDHPDIADSLIGLGNVLATEGQAAQAETILRQGHEIRRTKLPKDHPDIAEAESALGACLTRLRMFDEAESLLVSSYQVLRSKQVASRVTDDARQHLVDLYNAWGKPDKAAPYRAGAPKAATAATSR